MSDVFVKVNPGDPLKIGAQCWNALMDAGKASSLDRNVWSPALTKTVSSTIIRVLNETGGDLGPGSVVGLDGPIWSPSDATPDVFRREVTFRAATPVLPGHRRRFAVTLDGAPSGVYDSGPRVVRAYLSGVCQVKVDVLDGSHEYANPVTGVTDHMESSRHGHARILWREGDEGGGYGDSYATGVQWAIVMLGVTGSSFAVGKANGAISARVGSTYGIGSVDLYRSATDSYSDPTEDGPVETIDVLNASATTFPSGNGIDSGMYVSVAWDAGDVPWVAPLECATPPEGPYYG